MRLAVVSAPVLKTPPDDYGGMEGRAWCLADGLDKIGHQVFLFAKDGSKYPTSGWMEQYDDESELPGMFDVWPDKDGFDCIIDFSHDKVLSLERPDLPIINNHQVMSLMGSGVNPVFISQGQKNEKFPGVEGPVIHYGLDLDEYPFYDGPRDDYLLYMGQMIPEKRVHVAIEAAIAANIQIRAYGPWWGPAEYHDRLRELESSHPDLVSLNNSIGNAEKTEDDPIGSTEKTEALQRAKALIHLPGDMEWCEAGAIVVLEAMAVGTPVICTPNGCLVEYLEVPESPGVLVTNLDDAVQAVESVTGILPSVCRKRVEEHFTQKRFALEYAILASRVRDGLRWNTS